MVLQPPKPPDAKITPEVYSQYLRGYELYVKAYTEAGKAESKVERAKLYSAVVKGAEKHPSTAGKSSEKKKPEKALEKSKGKSLAPPAEKPKKVKKSNHTKNLRRERRRLAEKVADVVVPISSRSTPELSRAALKKVQKQVWPMCRIVPGNCIAQCNAGLRNIPSVQQRTVKWVTGLTVELIARGAHMTDRMELQLANGDIVVPVRLDKPVPGAR